MTEPVEQAAAIEEMWAHEAIHLWFSLSYANYLVVPRSVLQSMPDEWQARLVKCLQEMYESFSHLDWPAYDVRALKRETDLIDPQVTCETCDGQGSIHSKTEMPVEPDDPCAITCPECEGMGEVEDPEGPRYETPEEVGFREDPIPHYNRGRTRLEPKP